MRLIIIVLVGAVWIAVAVHPALTRSNRDLEAGMSDFRRQMKLLSETRRRTLATTHRTLAAHQHRRPPSPTQRTRLHESPAASNRTARMRRRNILGALVTSTFVLAPFAFATTSQIVRYGLAVSVCALMAYLYLLVRVQSQISTR